MEKGNIERAIIYSITSDGLSGIVEKRNSILRIVEAMLEDDIIDAEKHEQLIETLNKCVSNKLANAQLYANEPV